jgi:RNA polymerase sigma-70 factor (ECF subfamily)
MTTTDEELLGRHAGGDAGALDELVRRHVGRVRSMIFTMVLDHADADDLTQEVFCRALAALPDLRGRTRFARWLNAIAVHTTQSFLASRGRARARLVPVLADPPAAARDAPPARLLDGELDGAVTAALAGLSPKLRAAIVLTAVHGLGVAEAAAACRCTLPTFYWRVHRARAILGRSLERFLKP